MAPKPKGKQDANVRGGPKFLRSEILPVGEVSISGESGWRAQDRGRITELLADFKSGAYGQNTLAPPSLIGDNTCVCDGKRRLDKRRPVRGGLADLGHGVGGEQGEWGGSS